MTAVAGAGARSYLFGILGRGNEDEEAREAVDATIMRLQDGTDEDVIQDVREALGADVRRLRASAMVGRVSQRCTEPHSLRKSSTRPH